MKPFQDNVIVQPLPPKTSESGRIVLAPSEWKTCPACNGKRPMSGKPCKTCFARGKVKRERTPIPAKVIASGPGWHSPKTGKFIPNQTKPGDIVLIDPLAGDDWGEYRLVREGTQVEAVLEVSK